MLVTPKVWRIPFSTNVERVVLGARRTRGFRSSPSSSTTADRSEVERVSGQGLVPVIDHDGTVVVDSMRDRLLPRAALPGSSALSGRPSPPRRDADVLVDWFNRVWKRPPNEIEAEFSPTGSRIGNGSHPLAGEMAASLDRFETLLHRTRPPDERRVLPAADCSGLPLPQVRACTETRPTTPLFDRILDEHQQLDGRATRVP